MNDNINICFLQGKIISEIKFDFVYNSKKNISIIEFELETNDFCSLTEKNIYKNIIFAYDEIADEIYSGYEKDDFITLVGCVENNGIRILEKY